MRILQVASSLHDWGGIERYVHYLSGGLADRGHQVVVACPPGSPLDDRLKVPKVHITTRGKYNPLTAWPFLRLLRSQKFDVVHTHFSPDFQMPAWAARVAKVDAIVMTRHVALTWPSRKAAAYRKLYDRIIPVSEAVKKKLLESGLPDGMLTVAKAGVPPLAPSASKDATRARLGLDQQLLNIGSFGRLVPEKGVSVLLEAARRSQASVAVHVFGDGPAESDLRRSAPANATFHGRIDGVADAMDAMDVIAIPSVWEEAFPYSALEAMSLGKPIVASHVGGMPELVTEDLNGLLFPRGDASAMAACIDRLAASPSERARMGRAGQLRHQLEFTVDHMAERIEAVYLQALGESA